MGVIYILENKINGKRYVGKTIKTFKERFRQHQHSNSYIGKALCKNGSDNFEKILLENVPDEELDYWEIHYINECNSVSPNGYNLTYGGEGGKKSEEFKKMMSGLLKGEKNHNYGKHLSQETKDKISKFHKGKAYTLGKKYSRETKEKDRQAKLGNTFWLGKHHTEESKKKMSEAKIGKPNHHIGIPRSEESKRKMSEKKKNMSEETKRKMSKAKKGRVPWNKGIKTGPLTEEHKWKISVGVRKQWNKDLLV